MTNFVEDKAPTVVIVTWNGDKNLTRDEFIRQWGEHMSQCYCLVWDTTDMEAISSCKTTVQMMAGKEWDRLFRKQAEERAING